MGLKFVQMDWSVGTDRDDGVMHIQYYFCTGKWIFHKLNFGCGNRGLPRSSTSIWFRWGIHTFL